MQLLKKNIHTNRVFNIATTQITVDDDFIVPDVKPDVERIIMEDADIKIENLSCADGKISVRGGLEFRLLYGSRDSEGISNMKGAIVFDEKINHEDNDIMNMNEEGLNVECTVENIVIGIINTRKISVKAVIRLNVTKDELYDIETSVDAVEDNDGTYADKNSERKSDCSVSMLKKKEKISQVACRKNDILRIKDEMELSGGKANIGEILWKNVRISDVSFRALNGSVAVNGELKIFVVYKPVEEGVPFQWCESTFNFSGNVAITGCSDDMVPDIDYELKDVMLEVRNDYDGEPRIIAMDAVLAMNIRMYQDETIEYLADVYCCNKELKPSYRQVDYNKILVKNVAKTKVVGKFTADIDSSNILQICYSEGINHVKSKDKVENGVRVTGFVFVKIICLTDNDSYPFMGATSKIPYDYVIEVPSITPETECKITSNPVSLQASMAGAGEIEVKGTLIFECLATEKKKGHIIEDVEESALDREKIKKLPGIVGHVVKEGELLWDIAKEYRSTVESVRTINELKSDNVNAGDMLIVVKKVR